MDAKVWQDFWDGWLDKDVKQETIDVFATGQCNFLFGLLPEQALKMSAKETLAILHKRYGKIIDEALSPENTDISLDSKELPEKLQSPLSACPNGTWLKQANMVGINVRTIDSFWNVVKYSLTLPSSQNAIHLLPIWEPGVVGSLYGMSSWRLNVEFFSQELAELLPHLDTVEKQLRGVVNILHLAGRAVGIDVVPHTDRFSEMAFIYPEYYEWLQREDVTIVSHREYLHEEVQEKIYQFVTKAGTGDEDVLLPKSADELFSPQFSEEERELVILGPPSERGLRNKRRVALVRYISQYGYEPVPATMAPPYRGLEVDPRPEARRVDSHGIVWRDYRIKKPEPMSRVFGPLARYKLFKRLDDNNHWEINFDAPRQEVWDYVCRKYGEVQKRYGFDFMRGDMSHVQMRPQGPAKESYEHYDILGRVKEYVQKERGVNHFAYFAESFLAPRDTMTFGDEIDHLEVSRADAALGDLQSLVVGSPAYLQRMRRYADITATRSFAAAFTLFTGDKDDPRFDEYYATGSVVRLFTAMALADFPSYMGLGFETRDIHLQRAPNEHYTKLYVFEEHSGPNATCGPWLWGKNGALYRALTRVRLYFDSIWKEIAGKKTCWLLPPDATGEYTVMAWTQEKEPSQLFVVNTSADKIIKDVVIPFKEECSLTFSFSTYEAADECATQSLKFKRHHIKKLMASECRVYTIHKDY